jgi:hypothetical protein
VRSATVKHRTFSAVQEYCPPENYSPIAIRQSLLFWLGKNFALPILTTDSKSVSTVTKPAEAG